MMSFTRMTLLVGTTKGAFLISDDNDRRGWVIQGPYCDGWPINHVIGDPETGVIWAGGGGEWHGAGIWRSEDGGTSWKVTRLTKGKMDDWAANDPNFAKMIG
ncbi:MAG: exo-alpha-sialidase, partial [Pseudolabrys sp.]